MRRTLSMSRRRRAAVEPLEGRTLLAFSPVAVGPGLNVSHSTNYEGEATIAVDPSNPSRVFTASETDAGGLFVGYSTNGGATFTTRRIATGSDSLGRGDKNPQAAFDPFGNLYLSYLETVSQRAVRVAVSTDGGRTFSPLQSVVAAGLDQPSIAVGGDALQGASSVWVSYRNGAGGISAIGTRVDGAGTASIEPFSGPQAVPGSAGNFGDVAVGPTGDVVVTWQTNTGGEGAANINVSTDPDGLGPAGFSAPRTATTTNVGGFDFLPAQPNRAIDAEANLAYDLSNGASRGRLYLVYTDEAPDEGNNFDVFVRASADDGATWGAPVRVNTDATNRSQFLPDIAVDRSGGKVAVGWYDARDDAGVIGDNSRDAVPNDDVRYWGAVSTDGGVSFLNFPVSAGVSQAALSGSLNDFGDYTGVAAQGDKVFFAWADNSAELPDNPDRPQMELAAAVGVVSRLAGPRVDSAGPVGDVFGSVDHVDFTFDRPMDPSTFSVSSDVRAFNGPAGAIKAQVTGSQWSNNNTTLRVSFTPQTAPGVYAIWIGPDVRSVAGAQMDQDADGTTGESISDRFAAAFTVAPPRVVSTAPPSPRIGTVGSFDFTFNQPMDPATFAVADDVVSFTGPGGVDLRAELTGFAWQDNNTTLRVNFEKQGADGVYSMTVGPNIKAPASAGGWAMDQDGDFVPGEAGDDDATATFTMDRSTGPDAFGYQAWTAAFQQLDLPAGTPGVGTALDNVDDGSAALPLGSDTFNFYGRTYTGSSSLFVSSNGLITFGGGDAAFMNGDLAAAPSRPTIAVLWDDWKTDAGTDSRVVYRFDDVDGNGANDRLVVEWNSVPNAGGSGTNPATFQAILQLNTGATPGEILLNYPDLETGAVSVLNGASATVGIKDAGDAGDRRLLVSMNSGTGPYVAGGKAVRIATTPQPPQPPTVGSVTDSPDAVKTGGTVTLTANSVVDVDGAIASVRFYRESNGKAGLQTGSGGDLLLATDSSGNGGYTATASTKDLADGTYTYYAVATDGDGAASNVAAATGRIDNTPPTVDIVDVTDPRSGLMGSITIKFSEPVTGFNLADLSLTRNGGSNLLTTQPLSSTDGGTTWTLSGLTSAATTAGNYALTLAAANSGIVDVAGNALAAGATDSWRTNAAVVDRFVFYNQSNFDRVNVAVDVTDDIAIGVDKDALLPGQRATFANVTSYSRGLNGIMIDFAGLIATPVASDFEFRVGTTGDPAKWPLAPAPLSIGRRNTAGTNDSDRVSVVFPSGSIVNKWLQVTVKANGNTGLAAPDVFYFGNLVGETGDGKPGPTLAAVTAIDLADFRRQPFTNAAPVTSKYDFNRDGRVNAADGMMVRNATLSPALPLFIAPARPATLTAAARRDALFGESPVIA